MPDPYPDPRWPPQEPTAQRTLAACTRVERADPGERHARPDTTRPSTGHGSAGAALMAPRGAPAAPPSRSDQDLVACGFRGGGARRAAETFGENVAVTETRDSNSNLELELEGPVRPQVVAGPRNQQTRGVRDTTQRPRALTPYRLPGRGFITRKSVDLSLRKIDATRCHRGRCPGSRSTRACLQKKLAARAVDNTVLLWTAQPRTAHGETVEASWRWLIRPEGE